MSSVSAGNVVVVIASREGKRSLQLDNLVRHGIVVIL